MLEDFEGESWTGVELRLVTEKEGSDSLEAWPGGGAWLVLAGRPLTNVGESLRVGPSLTGDLCWTRSMACFACNTNKTNKMKHQTQSSLFY